MEKCFEYFMCNKTNCPAYSKAEASKCWETAGTLCHHYPTQEIMIKYKKDKCAYCLYYKSIHLNLNTWCPSSPFSHKKTSQAIRSRHSYTCSKWLAVCFLTPEWHKKLIFHVMWGVAKKKFRDLSLWASSLPFGNTVKVSLSSLPRYW